jgi:osmotically-inducible protein OsmY
MDTASSQVDVNSGIVTLSGTVNSLASKKYAILEAQKIEWWQRTGTRSQGPILSDEDLRAAVQAELSEDSRINPTDMNVTAELGHVTLMGTVRIQVEGYKYPWSD